MIVFIIGFMGSGKSTIGKKVSQMMNLNFVDLDKHIENNENKTITALFEYEGEDHFRTIEQNYLKELIKKDNLIIATGGGTPCYKNNMALMKKSGITLYLKMPVKAIFDRLTNSKNPRPLIRNKSKEELTEYITQTLEDREVFYSQANVIIDAININLNLLQQIIEHHQIYSTK